MEDETIQQLNARIETLEGENAALRAQIAGHRQNYRAAAKSLAQAGATQASLVAGLLSASEAE